MESNLENSTNFKNSALFRRSKAKLNLMIKQDGLGYDFKFHASCDLQKTFISWVLFSRFVGCLKIASSVKLEVTTETILFCYVVDVY